MLKSVAIAGLVLVVASAPLSAQSQSQSPKRVEASVWGGYVLSDGVEASTNIVAGNGTVYNRIDPKDGGVFGFNAAALLSSQVQVGFMYSHQYSQLLIGGPTAETDLGALGINTYHGYFQYDFLDGSVRPFALIGFGATNYSSVPVSIAGISTTSIPGQTKFSTTWAAGVNVLVNQSAGIRAAIRWTPTYIKSDPGGWWCDPFWGCYLTGDPQYSNQLEFSGGFTVRF